MIKLTGTGHLKVPARATLYYLAASASAKAIGILATPIFTRLLSGEGYGEYTLYITRLGFLSMSLGSVFAGAQGYRALSQLRDDGDEYISSLVGSAFAFCSAICILLFAFRGIFGLNFDLVLILTIQLFCDAILSVGNMRARFSYSYKQVFFTSFIQSCLSVLLALVLIRGAGLGYTARIWGLLIASLVVAAPVFGKMMKRSPVLYSAKYWRGIFKRALPLLPHAVSSALSVQIDRFIIGGLLGAAALAKYSVAHSLAAALSVLTGAVGSALSPWIIRKLRAGEAERVGEICSALLLLLGAATVAVVAIAPEAMRILAPADYSDAASAVAPIAISSIFSLIYNIGTVVLIHRESCGRVSLGATVSSFSAILFGFLLIPSLRYFGAGLAHLLSQGVAALAVLLLLPAEDRRIFSPYAVLGSLAVSVLLAASARGFAALPLARIIILLAVVLAAVLELWRVRGLVSEK